MSTDTRKPQATDDTTGSTRRRENDSPLDPSQRAFCDERSTAVRLLAPAGSGKTTSLLWRCLTLSAAAKPDTPRFLVFTFTRAARDELRERIRSNDVFEAISPYMEVTTLNAWGYRRLKSRLHNLGLITASNDRYWTMANNLQPLWNNNARLKAVLTDSRRKNRAARDLMDMTDTFKSLGFRHDQHSDKEDFCAHAHWLIHNGMHALMERSWSKLQDLEIVLPATNSLDRRLEEAFSHFGSFWCEAIVQLYQSSILTLEDQKYWAFLDLEGSVRDGKFTTGMHRFHHILVDEFQDINPLDLNLLKAVAAVNKSGLCIVGDDDQAIYEWRGATPEFILKPDQHIGLGFKTYTLEVNYRSPSNIVTLSQRLIAHNKRRIRKDVRAASGSGAELTVFRAPTLEHSVERVRSLVHSFLDDPSIRNVALIGRKRGQIIPYQIVFASEEMPFYAAEDLHVFLSSAFDDLKVILLLKTQSRQPFPLGPDPVEAILRICDRVKRYPLSKTDKQNLKKHLLASRPRTVEQALEALYAYDGPLKGSSSGGPIAATFYTAIRHLLSADTVSDALHAISKHFDGLQKDYGKSLDDIFYADPPFLYLTEYAERYGADFVEFYGDIEKAIATLARIPPEDDESDLDANDKKRPLHLMTALRAKGKEFDAVIILDCNQGVWPSRLAQTEFELEAERRLFYVAFTRVRRRLVLMVNDTILGESVAPSPYLAELGLGAE